MGRGGSRAGAGRPKLSDTVPVYWRIRPEDRDWITTQVKKTGTNTYHVIQQLIETFNSANQDK